MAATRPGNRTREISAQRTEMTTIPELIARAKCGDNDAFAEVWRRYEAQVSALCRTYLRSPRPDPAVEDADLATEVFIRALHQLERYEDRSDAGVGFDAWLLQVARRVCLNYLEKKDRRSRWRSDSALDTDIAFSSEHRPSVVGIVEERETLRIATQEINALPELYRTPFRLFLEDRSHAEIAVALGISVEGARKRIERARKSLRPRLREILIPHIVQELQTVSISQLRCRTAADLVSREIRVVERALSDIVRDYRIVSVQLPTGGELQLALREEQPTLREPEIELLRQKLAGTPRAWKKRLELAEICYHTGRWHEARQEYRDVLARRPACSAAAIRLGHILEAGQDRSGAADVYRTALEAVPRSENPTATALALRARLLSATGEVAAAAHVFRQAIRLAPQDRCNYYGLFGALGSLSRYADQLDVLEEIRKLDPLDSFAIAEVYPPCAHLGQFDLARTILEQAVSDEPNNPRAIKHLFQARMNLGLRDETTVRLAERLVELAPDLVDGWTELAWIYTELGREQDALAGLHRFLLRHPNSVDAHAALAWRYHYLKRVEEEVFHARRAYALAPFDRHACWTILTALGNADASSFDDGEGDRYAMEIADRFPEDAILLARLAGHSETRGRGTEALYYASRAVAVNHSSPEAQVSLAYAYKSLGRWHEAALAFESLVRMPGGRAGHWLVSYGDALRRAGDPRAAAIFAEALDVANAGGDDLLAVSVFEASGMHDTAVTRLRAILKEPNLAVLTRVWAENRLLRLSGGAADSLAASPRV